MPERITMQPLAREVTFCADELPLLTARVLLPHWEGGKGGRFNRYYEACRQHFVHVCRSEIFPRAEAAYCRARENAGPIPCWQAQMQSTVTLQRRGLLSLRTDTLVEGPPQRRIGCQGDTWDLQRGFLLALPDCFPPRAPWRRRLQELAAEQLAGRERQGVLRCHRDWQRELPRAFHAHRFYLTQEGLCLFFPLESLAPASEGVVTVCVAYDAAEGPFLPE